MKVIIKSDNVQVRSGTSKAGKAYTARTQAGGLDNGSDFPSPIRINLDEHQPPYPPGEYVFTDDSYTTNEFGDPVLSRYFKLVVASRPAARTAA